MTLETFVKTQTCFDLKPQPLHRGNDGSGAGSPDPDDTNEAEEGDKCGQLLDSTGPFAQCVSTMDRIPMVKDCAFEMAMRNLSQEALCDSLTVYHDGCVASGVKMPQWRRTNFCRESSI